MKPILLAVFSLSIGCVSGQYALGPDSQPQDGVPKGVISKHVLAPGKYYPGTPHNYSIYVPAQYDAAKPAPFMIFLDGSGSLGNQQRVPVVFDNLIAKHELPAMIGIFIDPGVLPAASAQAMSRYERGYEYDSLSTRYSQFLIDELIPEVSKKYSLTKDPNARGISGVSTGAVGAFAAAWNRPDQFRRVLSFIGTFVAMKGADELPGLIRKTEPKPLRVFLQAGKNDHIVPEQPYGTFYAGSWPVNNKVMQEAFESAGYDTKLELGDEGHNMKQGAAIMPDALRWLWRDYPAPIVVKEPAGMKRAGWDSRGKVYSLFSADKGWEQIGSVYKSVASPVGSNDGVVYFADPSASRIYKSDAGGKVTVFKENTSGSGALAAASDGRLYAAQPARKRIVVYSAKGDEKTVAQNVDAASLAVSATGVVYFLDPTKKMVGMVDAAGKVRTAYQGSDLAQPSAMSLSPDHAMMVITDAQGRFSWSFQVAPDGALINGEPFYRLEMPESGWMSEARSVTMDAIGQVYFATAIGIQGTEANGRSAMILNAPEHGVVSGIAFAGKDWNYLYAAEGGKLFRRAVKAGGVAPWVVGKLPRPPQSSARRPDSR